MSFVVWLICLPHWPQPLLRRQKSFLGSHASFEVYLEAGHMFMMAARRRKKSRNNSYVVSLDAADTQKDSDNIIGKVQTP